LVLEIKELSVSFKRYETDASAFAAGLKQKDLHVINNLSVLVRKGEITAIAGSSGSGKSLLAHAILGILPANANVSGDMLYCGQVLTTEKLKALRGREIALVPQSVAWLDPLMRVGKQVVGINGTVEKQRAVFSRYGLDVSVDRLYPFQLSGGMARRVLLSTAVMEGAKLIIADEPTPGLSVDLARRAMGHFRELADAGAGVLLITHDIDLAMEFADYIAVFYAGSTLEIAPAREFREGGGALRHPYSKALCAAIPQNGFVPIAGTQPYSGAMPEGCPFAPRCPQKNAACERSAIPMREVRGGEVRCVCAA
jgi:peptide/nickel transport system ATP-binding protein